MGNIILKCENLNKKFGKKQILKDVSLEIREGDILGFIGPNGAGKTTTIKCMLGLNSIDSGTVTINGYNVKSDFENAIKRVGAIVENPDAYMYLSGYQNLKMVANMYKGISKDRIMEVVKLVGLEGRIKDKVSKYSLGMRQRLGIAAALIHSPNVLILDEPTNGLDPEGIKELRDLLKKLAFEEHLGILISSHNLAELESFCTNVSIIKNGVVIENADIASLKQETSDKEYLFEVDDTSKIESILLDKLKYTIVSNKTFRVSSMYDQIPEIVKALVDNNIKIYEVKELKISLEEAFLNRTGGNKID